VDVLPSASVNPLEAGIAVCRADGTGRAAHLAKAENYHRPAWAGGPGASRQLAERRGAVTHPHAARRPRIRRSARRKPFAILLDGFEQIRPIWHLQGRNGRTHTPMSSY
jgi:hypothetical protein